MKTLQKSKKKWNAQDLINAKAKVELVQLGDSAIPLKC